MKKIKYQNGRALALPVCLREVVLSQLIRSHYMRVCGGRCDLCPREHGLRLVRRDGKPRKSGVYGLADIVNAGELLGDQLSLPACYTLRCARCLSKQYAAVRSARRRAAPVESS